MKLLASLLCCIAAICSSASLRAQSVLFRSDTANHVFYRIPALLSHGKSLLLFTDDRSGVTDATAWGDIGSIGNISIVGRRSKNCGRTWLPDVHTAMAATGCAAFDARRGGAGCC